MHLKRNAIRDFAKTINILLFLSLFLPCGVYAQIYEIDDLIQKLKDNNWEVRREAARVLGQTKNINAIESLVLTLKDEDPDVRKEAAQALGNIGKPAFEPLISALQEKDWRIREGAARALGILKEVRSIEYLIATLKNGGYWDVRWAATEALVNIGEPALEPFIIALKNNNLDIISDNFSFFIKRGLRNSESLLIEALNKYGYAAMAEAFLNCGNAQLAEAGRKWAKEHGYTISLWGGRGGPKWGSEW